MYFYDIELDMLSHFDFFTGRPESSLAQSEDSQRCLCLCLCGLTGTEIKISERSLWKLVFEFKNSMWGGVGRPLPCFSVLGRERATSVCVWNSSRELWPPLQQPITNREGKTTQPNENEIIWFHFFFLYLFYFIFVHVFIFINYKIGMI